MKNFNKLVNDIQKSLINETIKTKYNNIICEEKTVKLSAICKYLKRLANYYHNDILFVIAVENCIKFLNSPIVQNKSSNRLYQKYNIFVNKIFDLTDLLLLPIKDIKAENKKIKKLLKILTNIYTFIYDEIFIPLYDDKKSNIIKTATLYVNTHYLEHKAILRESLYEHYLADINKMIRTT